MGKSIMFIVRKNIHQPMFVGTTHDVIRVADSESILSYFMEKGNNIAPSKAINIDSYAPNFHLFGECVLFLLLIN
jgi:hypothetical protein